MVLFNPVLAIFSTTESLCYRLTCPINLDPSRRSALGQIMFLIHWLEPFNRAHPINPNLRLVRVLLFLVLLGPCV